MHQPKMPHFVTLSEAKGLSRWAERCFASAQHDRAVHQPPHRHLRAFHLLSPLQHLRSFSEVDTCSSTLAVAQYKRRILTTKKHVHNKSIAALKNTDQNERYVGAIQLFIEKVTNN
jgi:hypothetical protein